MSNIKYVCLSDLHLGAPSALLTDTTVQGAGSAPRLREAFAAALTATMSALQDSRPQPVLPGVVLLGDIFDLSLGTPRAAIRDFRSLLKALSKFGAQKWLGQFIFVPGNHDHELWTMTRLQSMAGDNPAADGYLHTTPAFAAPKVQPAAALIDTILTDNGFSGARTYYPNMGLMSADGRRAVVLHHGHFVESIYRAMSTLALDLAGTPGATLDAERLEKLNASWIDFVWSTDGDNGLLGSEIRGAYDDLLTGGEDLRLDHRLAKLLAGWLGQSFALPQTATGRKWTEIFCKALVDATAGQWGQMETFSYFSDMSADSRQGLNAYLAGPVLQQIAQERAGAALADLTFIFGHTHKPFEARLVADGLAWPVDVYNSGGWDLDTPMFGTRLGAAAVFIDDDLNVASLRLCNVPAQDGPPAQGLPPGRPRVAAAGSDAAANPLAGRLDRALTKTATLWDKFATEADAAYRAKQAWLLEKMAADDRRAERAGGVL